MKTIRSVAYASSRNLFSIRAKLSRFLSQNLPPCLSFSGNRLRFCICLFVAMLGSCSVKQIKQQEYDQSLTEEKQLRVDTNQDSSNYRAAQQYPSKLSPGQQTIETENLSGTSGKALTDQEQAALLEGKLDASLREFDDMLLKKNQGMSDSTHTETTTGENITINQGDRSESSSPEYSGETTEDNSDSGQTITGTKRYAQEYDNDDVVARQIREAAEKETDPELKKKLWVEYKRYKSGSN